MSTPFSAEVTLDVTDWGNEDRACKAAEIVTLLVRIARAEGLIDDQSELHLVRPTPHGMVGARLGRAVDQSAYAVASRLSALRDDAPVAGPATLTVVDAAAVRPRTTGDWGRGGLGVITLGPPVHVLVPPPDGNLGVALRRLARLTITVPDGRHAASVARLLDTTARTTEKRS